MTYIDCSTVIENGLATSSDCCGSCHSDAEMFDDMWEMHGLYDPTRPLLEAPLFGNICCKMALAITDDKAWELCKKLTEAEETEVGTQEKP